MRHLRDLLAKAWCTVFTIRDYSQNRAAPCSPPPSLLWPNGLLLPVEGAANNVGTASERQARFLHSPSAPLSKDLP